MALFIAGVIDAYIGPLGNDAIVPAIWQLDRLNDQTPLVESAELKVALWFCVPGPSLSFDWQGFRVRRLDRRERRLEFEIAVPNELPGHRVNAFVHETLKLAPALAETTLHRRRPHADWPITAVRSTINHLLSSLPRTFDG